MDDKAVGGSIPVKPPVDEEVRRIRSLDFLYQYAQTENTERAWQQYREELDDFIRLLSQREPRRRIQYV